MHESVSGEPVPGQAAGQPADPGAATHDPAAATEPSASTAGEKPRFDTANIGPQLLAIAAEQGASAAQGAAAVEGGRPSPVRLPGGVAWLGYGGLVPFLTLAAGSVAGGPHADFLRAALFSYAAIILSFVGALHWGIALAAREMQARQRSALFAWSVVPALAAWPALLVYAAPASLLLVGGFLAHYWQDRRLVRSTQGNGLLPAWYLPLRLQLTVVACICVAAGGLWASG
jgi:hypothetical protein